MDWQPYAYQPVQNCFLDEWLINAQPKSLDLDIFILDDHEMRYQHNWCDLQFVLQAWWSKQVRYNNVYLLFCLYGATSNNLTNMALSIMKIAFEFWYVIIVPVV